MAASLHICSSLIVAIKHEILPTLAAHHGHLAACGGVSRLGIGRLNGLALAIVFIRVER